MTNDEYIAFLSNLPDEPQPGDIRRITLGFAQHGIDIASGLYRAFNEIATRIEEKQDGFAHQFGALPAKLDLLAEQAAADRKDRATITRFLERMDARWDAMNSIVVTLRADTDLLRRDVDELKSDRTSMHTQFDAVLAALAELGLGINGRLTQLIEASKAASRAEGRAEGLAEGRPPSGTE